MVKDAYEGKCLNMASHPATKGVVLYPDGTYARRVFDSLEKMQESVGGLIEIMRLPNATAYINEEGKMHDLDFNNNATLLCLLAGNITYWDNIKGNMIVVGTDDGEGYDTDISAHWLETVENFWTPRELHEWEKSA